MDGGKVYEYECKDGALWTVSFGPLGPMAGMSGGRTNGSGEDSPAVFRTAARTSCGMAVVSGGQIRGETVNAPPCADIV